MGGVTADASFSGAELAVMSRNKSIPFRRRKKLTQKIVPCMEPDKGNILDETVDYFYSSETVIWAIGLGFGASVSALTRSALPLLFYTGAETIFAAICVMLAKFVLSRPSEPEKLSPMLATEIFAADAAVA